MNRGQRWIAGLIALLALSVPVAGVAGAQQADPSTTTSTTTTTSPSTTSPSTAPTTTPPSTTSAPAATAPATAGPASDTPDPGSVQTVPDPIPGHYIVTLKTGDKRAVLGDTVKVTKRNGGRVDKVWGDAIKGYAAEMTPAQAAATAQDPAVLRVEQDGYVHTQTTQTPTPSWGLDRIDQTTGLDNSYTYNSDGSGVHAYVIDTGILISNTDFGGRATVGVDEVGDGRNGIDCAGHGTHVAGTIGGTKYGVAKQAQLVAVRVLDCTGSGSYTNVISGINWVTANAIKPAVANMSLGGSFSSSLNDAVTASVTSGVTYAIAAGNNSSSTTVRDACNYSPASTPTAITVGATTSADQRATYSNGGTCVDILAPGSGITSDWIDNTTPPLNTNTNTNTISGTSMATPHVAGVAALYLAANPCASPAQVTAALLSHADTNVISASPILGTGTPNLLLNMQFIGPDVPITPGAPCPPVVTASLTPGNVHLSWTQDTVDGGAVDNFKVYKGATPGGESPTPIATLPSSASSFDDALSTGGTAYYLVSAVNATAEVNSNEISVTPPGKPVVTTSPGNTHVLLQWPAPTPGSSPITGYTIARSTTTGTETTLGTVAAGTLEYDDLTVANGMQYFYTVAANSGWGDTASNEVNATPVSSQGAYFPVTPSRILDSRTGNGTSPSPFTTLSPRTLQVTGRGGLPSNGVEAVVMNVTVTNPTTASHVTVWPSNVPLPTASNLNFVAGQTVPNLVTVMVSPSGQVNFQLDQGSADIIADVVGWYGDGTLVGPSGSRFHRATPYRILDSRNGTGGYSTPWGTNVTRDLTLTGVPSDATAVVLNLTITNPTGVGFATLWPSGLPRPDPASNLNYVPGLTAPNLVIAGLGANGKVSLYNYSGNSDFVADVVGWYGGSSADSVFTPVPPKRLLDSRIGTGLNGAWSAGQTRNLTVAGGASPAPLAANGVVMNFTVTNTTAPGFLTVWPAGAGARPDPDSNLNWASGVTVPNLVQVQLLGDHQLGIYNSAGNTDVVADVVGYFTTG